MSSMELFLRWWLEYQPVGNHKDIPYQELYDDYIRWLVYMPKIKHVDNISSFTSALKKLDIDGLTFNAKTGHSGASVSIDIPKILPKLPKKYFEL